MMKMWMLVYVQSWPPQGNGSLYLNTFLDVIPCTTTNYDGAYRRFMEIQLLEPRAQYMYFSREPDLPWETKGV
jgi:hypothetical protein